MGEDLRGEKDAMLAGATMSQALRDALRAQPAIPRIEDAEESRRLYRHFRVRMMYSMLVGYAAFYLVRKNFSMAMPSFLDELGYTRTDLGVILSLFSILYGAGKFINGVLADRANPRYFMAIGLLGAAAMNIAFGLSSSVLFFGVFWLANAWFQSMGWPPCARMLTHWYSPTERGTMWGLWNASHQVGGAAILVMAGYLISNFGWRSAFYVPAVIAIAVAFFLAERLRDTPDSLGLPPVEVYRGEREEAPEAAPEEASLPFKEILFDHVLSNRLIWYVCIANFFVYIVRIGVLDWAPTLLVESRGSDLKTAGWIVAAFEIAGIVGALAAGALSDRLFRGRRGPAAVLCMVLLVVSIVVFWKLPAGNPWLDAALLVAIGFFVYGPQMLVGVAAADFASKNAAATATGLTGTFGYLGSAVCGVGTGLIVDRWGWDGGILFFIASAVVGTLFFLLIWNARGEGTESVSVSHQGRSR